eukprot:scaffold3087_cov130-Alexandrium_tamarense.AAC.18
MTKQHCNESVSEIPRQKMSCLRTFVVGIPRNMGYFVFGSALRRGKGKMEVIFLRKRGIQFFLFKDHTICREK